MCTAVRRRSGQADNQLLVCVIKWWFIKCEKALWPKANRCLSGVLNNPHFLQWQFPSLISEPKKGPYFSRLQSHTHTYTYTLLLCLHWNIHTYGVFFSPFDKMTFWQKSTHIMVMFWSRRCFSDTLCVCVEVKQGKFCAYNVTRLLFLYLCMWKRSAAVVGVAWCSVIRYISIFIIFLWKIIQQISV